MYKNKTSDKHKRKFSFLFLPKPVIPFTLSFISDFYLKVLFWPWQGSVHFLWLILRNVITVPESSHERNNMIHCNLHSLEIHVNMDTYLKNIDTYLNELAIFLQGVGQCNKEKIKLMKIYNACPWSCELSSKGTMIKLL